MKPKNEQLKPVETIPTNGFMSIHCCQCGARHVYHFRVDRGANDFEDLIVISHFRDFNYERLKCRKK